MQNFVWASSRMLTLRPVSYTHLDVYKRQVLDNRDYQIKVKEAEAALLDAHGSQDVLHSGIETSHTNICLLYTSY